MLINNIKQNRLPHKIQLHHKDLKNKFFHKLIVTIVTAQKL